MASRIAPPPSLDADGSRGGRLSQVTRGSSELGFFTVQEFAEWRAANPAAGGRVKYLKGLGSSNNLDAKKYFSHVRARARAARRRAQAVRLLQCRAVGAACLATAAPPC